VVLVSAAWAWVLIAQDTSWQGWLRYAVAVVAVLAAAVLVVARFAASGLADGALPTEAHPRAANPGTDKAQLTAAGWLGNDQASLAMAGPATDRQDHSAAQLAIAQPPAGGRDNDEARLTVSLLASGEWVSRGTIRPAHCGLAVVGALLAIVTVLLAPAVWSVATALGPSNSFMGTTNATAGPYVMSTFLTGLGPKEQSAIRHALDPLIGDQATDATLTAGERAMLDYALANAHTPIALAVEGGALVAGNYLVLSDAPIVVMSGFEGADPAPNADGLASWVKEGRVRFVVSHTSPPPTKVDTTDPASIFGGLGGPNEAARVIWVQSHCKPVPGLGGDGNGLFDCGS
jgi:hypothetical protein